MKPRRKTGRTRSEATQHSWQKPEVAASRSMRYVVKVDATLHSSVRQAYKNLGLDDTGHREFRRELVLAVPRSLRRFGHQWRAIRIR